MGNASSRIERVTVYRQGARVERVMTLEGAAADVRFGGLPLALEDGSVRARAVGDGGALAVDVRVGIEVPADEPGLAPADDAALTRARLDAERCRAEVSRVQTAMARLEALRVLPRPPPREGEPLLAIPLESRHALVELRVAEEERLAGALAAATASAREADKALADATDAAKRATTARNAREHELRKVAIVSLVGAREGAQVRLEYAIPDARWSPSYVLTLDGASAKLGMRALVAQRSGEDWTGVRLELSTAAPDAWVELPELATARIGRAQPRPRRTGYREPPEGASALYADYDRVAGGPSLSAPPAPPPSRPAVPGEDDASPTLVPGGARGGGGPPPRPAAAALRASGAPLAAAYGASPSPPASPGMAPMAERTRRAGSPGAAPARDVPAPEAGGPPPVAPPAPPQAWDLAAESLAFGQLRMRAPSDPARGELVAVAQASVYLEALGAQITVDVAAAIRVAVSSVAIDARALPTGYELARASDAYDYLYAAEAPCDVASDGAFHAVSVADWDAETALQHVVVPRDAPQVYRLLDLASPIDAALLPGPLDVYEVTAATGEAMYRTTTRMPSTPPRGRVEVGLGVEPAIKVARTVGFQEETAGLLGGSLSLVHRVSVELRNLLPRPVTVEVRERVPVTRKDDTEVKVELGAVEPAWETWDQEQSLRGGYRWRVSIEPGATRTLTARYTVKLASKLELVGGNRRDS